MLLMSKKSKLIKASLFSLLALGALSAISTTLVNHNVKHEEISLEAEEKKVTSDNNEVTEYVLQEDERRTEPWEINTDTTIDLNGHILSFNARYGQGIVLGEGVTLTVIDSNPNTEHKYYVDPTYHYWVLDEQLGDKVVKGGVIYSENQGTLISAYLTDPKQINLLGGTLCGAGGGAVWYRPKGDAPSTIVLDGTSIRGNCSSPDLAYGGTGGGLYIDGGTEPITFLFKSGLISDNYASSSGGGIYLYLNVNFTMTGGTITNNISDGAGGGISNYENRFGKVEIMGGTISYNSAINGGGIYSMFQQQEDVTVGGDILITHNHATENGGGIYIGYGTNLCDASFNVNGGEISYNEATKGGGIYFLNHINELGIHPPEDSELIISNNIASEKAGGVYIQHANDQCETEISGKIIVKDNRVSSENEYGHYDNLFVDMGYLKITGPLTGSDIYFNAQKVQISDMKTILGYENSGATLKTPDGSSYFANEFFHYDGEADRVLLYNPTNGTLDLISIPAGGGVSHPIAFSSTPEVGVIKANYDDAYRGLDVYVIVNPSGVHTLKSLSVYFNGEDHDILESKSFTMPDEPVIIKAGFIHPNIQLIKGKAPTCFEDGYKDYYYCPDCGQYYEDSSTNIVIPNIETWKVTAGKIEKLKHILKHIEGKAPTALEAGYKDYYECSECHHYYEDAEATIAIEDIEVWKKTKGAIAPTLGVVIPASLITASVLMLAAAIFLAIYPARKYKLELAKANKSPTTFTDISYTKGYSPKSPKLDKYTIRFRYRNTYMSYFMFTPKVDQVSEAEIKERFNKLTKNGELKKYADNYYGAYLRKKLIILTIVALLALTAIGIATYLYLLF